MGKFYIFLLAGVATGIWYAVYREPTESSHDEFESMLKVIRGPGTKDAAYVRYIIHELALTWFEYIETLNCRTKQTDNMGWATPPEIVEQLNNFTEGVGLWGCGSYRVLAFQMESTGNQIAWNRGDDFVTVIEYWDRAGVTQMWILGSAVVVVDFSPDDDNTFVSWMLEKATMVYHKKKGHTTYKWTDDKKDVQALRICHQHMLRWCDQNGEWMARRRLPCLLHDMKDEDIF